MIEYFEDAVDHVMDELKELMIRKQKDYGPGNIMAFGEFGVLVRINDKIERLKNLYKTKTDPSCEAIEDTWQDIANYAVIALMVRRGIFTKPLMRSDLMSEATKPNEGRDC